MRGGLMPRTEKLERVAKLQERIEGSTALLLTEYRGLTVSEISDLRRALREADASFAVVKNTLMQRAAAAAGMELTELLSGPSAVAFVGGDAVTAAKQIKAAAKQFPSLILKGGFMDGQVLTAEDANRLADLESREVMLSKIAGLLKGEMSRAASVFQSAQSGFLSLLEAFRDTLPAAPAGSGKPDAEAPAAQQMAAEEDAPSASDPGASTENEQPAEGSEEPAAVTEDETDDEEGKG
jgi:large subunit ribosomal protein L10